jgi:hypothetical protein
VQHRLLFLLPLWEARFLDEFPCLTLTEIREPFPHPIADLLMILAEFVHGIVQSKNRCYFIDLKLVASAASGESYCSYLVMVFFVLAGFSFFSTRIVTISSFPCCLLT